MRRARPTRLYPAYLFDLDGTVYLGDELLPGAASVIEALREVALVRFVSNNPTRPVEAYAEKLTRMGLAARPEELVTTVGAFTSWMKANHPGKVVFPIAEEPVVAALRAAGFTISDDPSRIDVVIASYDRTFDYRKLQVAFDALWFHRRAILVATNPDRYCPLPGGRGEPDCAAIVAAIEACSGARCEFWAGKPSPTMAQAALDGTGVKVGEALMVGDRLATDIAMGRAAGMDTALVLTGDSSAEEAAALPEADRPTYLLDGLGELLPEPSSAAK